jgi:hypothetical protein
MTRRIVVASCVLGVLGGTGATLAYAAHSSPRSDQQVCIVLAKDPQHKTTQDFCIDIYSVAPHA